MTDKRWKSVERKVAAKLGGERIPITGRQRGSAPDCTSAGGNLSIEVKDRKKIPEWLKDAMSQAIASQRDGQIPIVVLHECGMATGDNLLIIRLNDWCDLYGDVAKPRPHDGVSDELL
jgi:hypothetical protein